MSIYLALGTNLGDRKANLELACKKLCEHGIEVLRTSMIYETPAALLLGNARDEWNIPYFDGIVEVKTKLRPLDLLKEIKSVEREMGRNSNARWSTRIIDIDIIFYNDEVINEDILTIPHKLYKQRTFVLDPISNLNYSKVKNLNIYRPGHQPTFMGIINITPDSFSDSKKQIDIDSFKEIFNSWSKQNVGIIDIGAESTRPGASPIDAREELTRLGPVFDFIRNRKRCYFEPILSIDTYHPETAKEAILNGFNMVNDVHGLEDVGMLELAKEYKNIQFVFTHNLDIKDVSFDRTLDVVTNWLDSKINLFVKNNLNLNNMIFDPGIGFGKNATQSLQLLQNISVFHKYDVRILVGHSRKSFMKIFSDKEASQRDSETLALSLGLARQVDILRVHDPVQNQKSLLAFDHLYNQFFMED